MLLRTTIAFFPLSDPLKIRNVHLTIPTQERYAKKNETEELRRAFEIMDSKKDGKVDAEELSTLFAQLGHKCKKNEIEDMIWEVDEDCDKCVNWDEFQVRFLILDINGLINADSRM